tara:strand:+ start:1492 stop:2211 length:720 start_codon:yes stop_codon:yes gene_type:complete
MDSSSPQDKIILALDGLNLEETTLLLKQCPKIKWVKVGLELFLREGPQVIKFLKNLDKKIFLDLKFYDIPNTMSAACYQAAKLGVDIISLHSSAGLEALKVSKDSSIKGAIEIKEKPPLIIGVTVLTSFSKEGFNAQFDKYKTLEEYVLMLAELSLNAGLDGCVCSPLEVEKLRLNYGYNFQLITPGIRLVSNTNNDQKRVLNPKEALSKGASKLVIGRAITNAEDPNKIFTNICKDIS